MLSPSPEPRTPPRPSESLGSLVTGFARKLTGGIAVEVDILVVWVGIDDRR